MRDQYVLNFCWAGPNIQNINTCKPLNGLLPGPGPMGETQALTEFGGGVTVDKVLDIPCNLGEHYYLHMLVRNGGQGNQIDFPSGIGNSKPEDGQGVCNTYTLNWEVTQTTDGYQPASNCSPQCDPPVNP